MSEYILYKHINKSNQKQYIGMTNNIERRWRCNGIEYKPSKKENQNRKFWNAIQKYGWDNFEHIIILENLTFDEAIQKEIEYIELLKTTNRKYGYNISSGGNGGKIYQEHPKGMLGKQQTDYQKESHKKWASVKENNCMTNGQVVWGKTHNHPKGMLGKTHSGEYKKQVSEFMTNNHPNFKKCYAVMPDGSEIEFKSPKFFCEYFKIPRVSSSIYLTMKKEPYKVKSGSTTKRYDLEGIMIRFENQQS